jgi:hypothetical protein
MVAVCRGGNCLVGSNSMLGSMVMGWDLFLRPSCLTSFHRVLFTAGWCATAFTISFTFD